MGSNDRHVHHLLAIGFGYGEEEEVDDASATRFAMVTSVWARHQKTRVTSNQSRNHLSRDEVIFTIMLVCASNLGHCQRTANHERGRAS